MEVTKIIEYLKNLRVLYVEDNKDALEELGKFLKKIFDCVDFASNGKEGLDKFISNGYDIIISDINMPEMNGIEMLKNIKSQKEDAYTILITAFNETDYYLDAIKIGVDGFILKPVDFEQIFNVLGKIANSHHHKQQAQKYFSLLNQYQQIVDENAIVLKTDIEGNITYINNIFEKLLKYKKEEVLSRHYKFLLKEFSEKFREEVLKILKEKRSVWRGVLKFKDKNNKTLFLQGAIKAIFENDEIVEYIFIGYDISEVMKPRKFLLNYMSIYPNAVITLIKIENFENIRRLFDEAFTDKIEDKFKKILEEFVPDEVDEIYALENGIFAAVCNGEKDIFSQYVEKWKNVLRDINSSMLEIDGLKYDIYVHISIARGKEAFENARFGLEKLQETKHNFIVANGLVENVKQKAINNLKILHLIKEAIINDNIVCAFQPIIDNKTEKILKYETLVRIKKGSTLIPPGQFLDIAKEGNFYSQITKIVLAQSIEKIRNLKNISVNISEIDIQKESLRNFMYEILEQNSDIAHKITFELLEDENVDKIFKLEEFINNIKSKGVKIAIDDFGSGYSNFYRLQKYRPDYLKIDGSLIKNIKSDNYSRSIVRSIVEFANENNIKTIAEYVENREIFEEVKRLGITCSQGYYFGKPTLLE